MGMMIDEDKLVDHFIDKTPNGWLVPICENTSRWSLEGIISEIKHFKPTVEAISKADYENRLKADLVAMLTDLSMEIGEIEDGYTEFDEENKRSLTMIPLESVDRLIKQKIDVLKENKDGSN